MRKFIARLFPSLRCTLDVHGPREVFCFGELAVVKCMSCGAESMPWQAPPLAAKEWQATNPGAAERYLNWKASAEEKESKNV